MNKSEIIFDHALTFDPADKNNGSLYLGVDKSIEPGTNVDLIIDMLRGAGLWSSEPCKEVPDEHRKAYEEQLELIEVAKFRDADSPFIAARFNHQKYPSSQERWDAWLEILNKKYHRC